MTHLDRAVGRMNLRKNPIIPMPKPVRRDQRTPDVQRQISASADRIDAFVAVFAFGVLFGMWIA